MEAISRMAKMASSDNLKKAFEKHLDQTRIQIARVEQAFADTGKAARAKTCEAMKGLIKEASLMMEQLLVAANMAKDTAMECGNHYVAEPAKDIVGLL